MENNFRDRCVSAMSNNVIIGDGHSLYGAEFYSPYFTEEELTEAGLLRNHASDNSSWKSTIYDNNGNALDELFAVYNLEFLYWVVRKLGLEKYPQAIGRGSQAQELVSFIYCELEQDLDKAEKVG